MINPASFSVTDVGSNTTENYANSLLVELQVPAAIISHRSLAEFRELELDGFLFGIDLRIHTNAAKYLVTGFKDETNNLKSQIGLGSFNKKIKAICNDALNDNPLADAVLINMEEKMRLLQQEMQEVTVDLRTRLQATRQLTHTHGEIADIINYELEAHQIRLRFKYPYPVELVKLINAFDTLCVLLMMMHKEMLMDRESIFKVKRRFTRQFRSIMKLVETWDSRISIRRQQLGRLDERQQNKLKEYLESRNIIVCPEIIAKQRAPSWLLEYARSSMAGFVL